MEVLSLERDIDLLVIPARRLLLSPIHETANLWDVLEAMRSSQAEALYVPHQHNLLTISVRGVVTEDAIKNYYRI